MLRRTRKTTLLTQDLKDKYQNLVNEDELELPLPMHYKHLIRMCDALDTSLNLFNHRKVSSFDDLKRSIESLQGHTFELLTFQQIYNIAPEFYQYSWTSTRLIIDFPKDIAIIVEKLYS